MRPPWGHRRTSGSRRRIPCGRRSSPNRFRWRIAATAACAFWPGLTPAPTIAGAQRNLGALAAQLAEAYPDSNRNISVQVLPLVESLTGSVRPALIALIGAAGLFLLIACANVASLLLARGSARGREFATRAALGAGRARLVRQLMTESLLLAALGGCAGVAVAAAGLSLARQASAMLDIPRLAEAVFDLPVLLVALALSTATGLLFGLMPALRLTHSADRGGTADPRGVRIRQLLIAGVTAITLMLVFSASMLFDGFPTPHRIPARGRRTHLYLSDHHQRHPLEPPAARPSVLRHAAAAPPPDSQCRSRRPHHQPDANRR